MLPYAGDLAMAMVWRNQTKTLREIQLYDWVTLRIYHYVLFKQAIYFIVTKMYRIQC
jgi:hypothetical protein